MSYKDVIRRSHPYEGDTPQKCTVEVVPIMTGHDGSVEPPQGEAATHRQGPGFFPMDPYMVIQDEEKSWHEPRHSLNDPISKERYRVKPGDGDVE